MSPSHEHLISCSPPAANGIKSASFPSILSTGPSSETTSSESEPVLFAHSPMNTLSSQLTENYRFDPTRVGRNRRPLPESDSALCVLSALSVDRRCTDR